jgi:type IV pilus assembly protein PilZ
MTDQTVLSYVISDPIELNLSYMPFILNGGLFVPTYDQYALNDKVQVNLQLPGKKEALMIEGKVVWITSKNALHHVLAGVGIQFTGANASTVKGQLENLLDNSMEIGGYTYGITDTDKRQ